jgi:hypothetical protein
MNFDNIARRTHDLQRHRNEYIMRNFNQIWFVDEYFKLKSFDIEIYDDKCLFKICFLNLRWHFDSYES